MTFISEEIVDRLENEWRQIQESSYPFVSNDASLSPVVTHPADQARKLAAMAMVGRERKKV